MKLRLAACGGWSRREKLCTGNDGVAGGTRLLAPTEPVRFCAMFVAPGYAPRGLGRRILEACEDAVRRERFTHVELMATVPRVPLYRACGYVEQAPFDAQLPDGLPLPCLRMLKSL